MAAAVADGVELVADAHQGHPLAVDVEASGRSRLEVVDGSVTPCCYLRPDMGETFVMGNVFDTQFAAIWRGEKYRAFRAQMLTGRESMPVCNKCRGGTHDLIAAVEEVS